MYIDNTDDLITAAIKVLEDRVKYEKQNMNSPEAVKNLLRLKLGSLEHEEFHVLWLNAQNEVIEIQMVFRGSITQTSVYPRELVKEGLKRNAAQCILVHNHPSGVTEPSGADKLLTTTLKQTLALVDIGVLDHFIVSGAEIKSFAEMGLI